MDIKVTYIATIILLCMACNWHIQGAQYHEVYSHGFGEDGTGEKAYIGNTYSAPQYPDAPGNIRKACFYTREAVLTLADHLVNCVVNDKKERIILRGRSMGCGTIVNCLRALLEYENNTQYFEGSSVTSSKIANQVFDACNQGGIILSEPVIDFAKTRAMAETSTILSLLSCCIMSMYIYWGTNLLGMVDQTNIVAQFKKIGLVVTASSSVYLVLGSLLKKVFSSSIKHRILPIITNWHFDPSHPTPLESAQLLHGKVNLLLLHVHKNDGVIENPDDDMQSFYDLLKKNENTYLITDDGRHNRHSKQYLQALKTIKSNFQKESLF